MCSEHRPEVEKEYINLKKKKEKKNGGRSIQALRNTLGSLATLCFITLYMHFIPYPDPGHEKYEVASTRQG